MKTSARSESLSFHGELQSAPPRRCAAAVAAPHPAPRAAAPTSPAKCRLSRRAAAAAVRVLGGDHRAPRAAPGPHPPPARLLAPAAAAAALWRERPRSRAGGCRPAPARQRQLRAPKRRDGGPRRGRRWGCLPPRPTREWAVGRRASRARAAAGSARGGCRLTREAVGPGPRKRGCGRRGPLLGPRVGGEAVPAHKAHGGRRRTGSGPEGSPLRHPA
jgi:hypothetical protein